MVEKYIFFNLYIGMSIVCKCIIDVYCFIFIVDVVMLCDVGNKLRYVVGIV